MSFTNQGDDNEDSDDDYSDFEDDESLEGLKENKMAQLVLNDQNSPIPHFQNVWGMKDVELKITPEALEIIANQVRSCNQYVPFSHPELTPRTYKPLYKHALRLCLS